MRSKITLLLGCALLSFACLAQAAPEGGCATLTCPANVTRPNDPNQCGAVATYPAPTTTGACGAVTCIAASGSFFPRGTTTVTCSETMLSCTFTVTINDTQPPQITAPPNQTATPTGPGNPVVNYPAPTASDNCPGVTAACTPPSGSSFPPGSTTVTCTATDVATNTASASFSVTVGVFNPAGIPLLSPLALLALGLLIGAVALVYVRR